MNPSDWTKVALLKTTTNEYLGDSPFQAPTQASLWGRPVAKTPAMPAGTALVGAFRSGGAQLFQRGGLRVEASNSHVDFFIKNLVAIRAEIRASLAVFRPVAFGTVTGI
jgi:HK97 family phage major capsid protein